MNTHHADSGCSERRRSIVSALAGVLLAVSQVGQSLRNFPEALISSPAADHTTLGHLAFTHPGLAGTLLGYAFLWLGSHIAIYLCVSFAYGELIRSFKREWEVRWAPFIVLLLMLTLYLILINRQIFPSSRAFQNSDLLLAHDAGRLLFWLLTVILVGGLCLAVTLGAWRRRAWAVGAIIISLFLGIPDLSTPSRGRGLPGNASKPDIILIGIDSMRPDMLASNGAPTRNLLPNINRMADSSVLFSDTLTTQARTFVALTSLLSGQYPTQHGARFNLFPRSRVDRPLTLPAQLARAGYLTALATDDTQFANIDQSFGFDEVEAPPAGIVSMMLASGLDSIGTNLISLTPRASLLLPHVYANRAATVLYRPGDFSKRTDHLIRAAQHDRPLFLLVHYCLPHWPFLRPGMNGFKPQLSPEIAATLPDAPESYIQSLAAVDTQLGQTVETLRRNRRLDNAILVIYSDHGESIGRESDWMIDMGRDNDRRQVRFYGHGTNALADVESRVVLGFQRFVGGVPQWKPRTDPTPASLVDVAPSVLNQVDPNGGLIAPGTIILPLDTGNDAQSPKATRYRFVESGLVGSSLLTAEPDQSDVASEFLGLYRITPDLRAELTTSAIADRLQLKERAVYWSHFALATHAVDIKPSPNDCWKLADFDTREVRCVQDSASNDAVASAMRQLCDHHASDPQFSRRWCSSPPSSLHP